MGKAEDLDEKALNLYPMIGSYDNLMRREGFIEGYRQAEKDLALTNADVYDIWRLYNEVCAEGKIFGFDETSQEVLKRFNEIKK